MADRFGQRTTRGALDVLDATPDGVTGLDAVVTTRHGGVSRPPYDSLNLGLHVGDDDASVVTNRQRVADALSSPLDRFVYMDQVHGATVAVVDDTDAGRGTTELATAIQRSDACVTTTPHLTLVVLVADCTPMVLFEPRACVLGVAHAGWRGVAACVATRVVDVMVEHGADLDHIHAVIGPSVNPARYPVGDDVTAAFTRALGPVAPSVLILRGDEVRADIAGANAALLAQRGVAHQHIHRMGMTSDDPLLFSDRLARPCGRFALMARMTRSDRSCVESS